MPHDRLRFARGRRPHAGRRSRRYMRQEQPPSKRGPASAPGPRYSLDTESRSGERQKQVIEGPWLPGLLLQPRYCRQNRSRLLLLNVLARSRNPFGTEVAQLVLEELLLIISDLCWVLHGTKQKHYRSSTLIQPVCQGDALLGFRHLMKRVDRSIEVSGWPGSV